MKALKQAVASEAPAIKLAPQPPDLYEIAEAFLKAKARKEKLETELQNLQTILEPELMKVPGMCIAVGKKDVMLIPTEKRVCDLESAKKKLGKAKLAPYIEIIEKLDLKAAEKHLDLSAFIQIIHGTQLRTPDRKGAK